MGPPTIAKGENEHAFKLIHESLVISPMVGGLGPVKGRMVGGLYARSFRSRRLPAGG